MRDDIDENFVAVSDPLGLGNKRRLRDNVLRWPGLILVAPLPRTPELLKLLVEPSEIRVSRRVLSLPPETILQLTLCWLDTRFIPLTLQATMPSPKTLWTFSLLTGVVLH